MIEVVEGGSVASVVEEGGGAVVEVMLLGGASGVVEELGSTGWEAGREEGEEEVGCGTAEVEAEEGGPSLVVEEAGSEVVLLEGGADGSTSVASKALVGLLMLAVGSIDVPCEASVVLEVEMVADGSGLNELGLSSFDADGSSLAAELVDVAVCQYGGSRRIGAGRAGSEMRWLREKARQFCSSFKCTREPTEEAILTRDVGR